MYKIRNNEPLKNISPDLSTLLKFFKSINFNRLGFTNYPEAYFTDEFLMQFFTSG